MAESKTLVRYQSFQIMRSRFIAGNEAWEDAKAAQCEQLRKENSSVTRRKINTHSNARLSVTQLVSLVEKGDLLQQSLGLVRD